MALKFSKTTRLYNGSILVWQDRVQFYSIFCAFKDTESFSGFFKPTKKL